MKLIETRTNFCSRMMIGDR